MNLQMNSVVFLTLFVTTTTALPIYQTYIPNGPNVPSPCQPGTVWSGVGHRVPAGGGDRNPFGLAFAANQYNWTKVCPLDSDGDGRTNGQELGDPNCTWKVGMTSPSATGLSHPGICEPLDSHTCMSLNSWLTCPSEFNCPAVNQPGVISSALRLPPTAVPANETTYIRYGLFLPNDTDYHLIAYTPIINTSQVLHHMILYGCNDQFKNYANYSTPHPAGLMPDNDCLSLITIWAVGLTGDCLRSEFGILIGKTGFKYALLEIHWNNPIQSTSYVDSSGMTIYYTPKLRPNSGGVVVSGQASLNILPGQNSISFQGGCSSYCSSAVRGTMYIASTVLHMHLLGKSGSVKLFRNGVLNATLLDALTYDYNSPVLVRLDPPVEFHPGDSIVVNCTYQSTSRNSTVKWGERTSDEMCYAFLTYYPVKPLFSVCSKWRSIDICSNIDDRCETNGFYTLVNNVTGVCLSPTSCSSTCKDLMQTIVNTGCVTDDYLYVISATSPAAAKGLTHLVSLCGVSKMSTIPNTANSTTMSSTTLSSTTANSTTMSSTTANSTTMSSTTANSTTLSSSQRSSSSTVKSSGPNSAKRLSTGMKLLINTALPTLSFVLTLCLTACSLNYR